MTTPARDAEDALLRLLLLESKASAPDPYRALLITVALMDLFNRRLERLVAEPAA